MGYLMQDGRWASTTDLDLSPSAAVAADGNSVAVELGDCAVARLMLAVVAISGTTPTLDVTVQTSHDGEIWSEAGTFTQVDAASIASDADGVMTAKAAAVTDQRYVAADFDGAIGASFDAPCYVSATLSSTTGAFVVGSTITITGTYLGEEVTEVLTVTSANGNETLTSTRLFDSVKRVSVQAQALATGTVSIGATLSESERKLFLVDRYVRAVFDVGGTTPSFGVVLRGEAA